MKDYVGSYSHPAFGEVEVVLEDEHLVYHRTPSMILDLRCEQADTFLGRFRDVADDLRAGKLEITFQTDAGKVTGFSEGELDFAIVD